MRAAAQICTGVGFIGAGVIAKGGGKSPVRGVTTACAVWVSAALGVVAASGMWLFALYSAGLSVTILRISRWYIQPPPRRGPLGDRVRLALTRGGTLLESDSYIIARTHRRLSVLQTI